MNSLATRTRPEIAPVRLWTRRDGTIPKGRRMNGRMLGLVLQSVAIAIIFTIWVVKAASRATQQYRKVLHKKAGLW